MSIKVGDKVRLLAWEGECEGLTMTAMMHDDVGTVQEVTYVDAPDSEVHNVIVADWWWPLSKVEKLP